MYEDEIRSLLMGAKIVGVTEICGRDGDELILRLESGEAVHISASTRIRLTVDEDCSHGEARLVLGGLL